MEVPRIESKEFLAHSVQHFIKHISKVEVGENKELWAISQIYRSWEMHKDRCKELKITPRFNNDDVINEIAKHFKVEIINH